MMADPVLHLGVGVYAAEDGRCAQLELPSTDNVTRDQTPLVTSAQVQPSADFMFVSANGYVDLTIHHDCIDFWKTQLSDMYK